MPRGKFLIFVVIFLAIVIYVISSSMRRGAQFFMTVEEVVSARETLAARPVRVLGVVVGETISFDAQSGILTFEIAHVPADDAALEAQGGLAVASHTAARDPQRPRLIVRYRGVIPTMLQDEAQVIVGGYLGKNGIFEADELLFKCPSRYEEVLPEETQEQ